MESIAQAVWLAFPAALILSTIIGAAVALRGE